MLLTINAAFGLFWTGEAIMNIDLRYGGAKLGVTVSRGLYARDVRSLPSLATYHVRPEQL